MFLVILYAMYMLLTSIFLAHLLFCITSYVSLCIIFLYMLIGYVVLHTYNHNHAPAYVYVIVHVYAHIYVI